MQLHIKVKQNIIILDHDLALYICNCLEKKTTICKTLILSNGPFITTGPKKGLERNTATVSTIIPGREIFLYRGRY